MDILAWCALFLGVVVALLNGAISALGGERIGALLWGLVVLGEFGLAIALVVSGASNPLMALCVGALVLGGAGLAVIYRLERKGAQKGE